MSQEAQEHVNVSSKLVDKTLANGIWLQIQEKPISIHHNLSMFISEICSHLIYLYCSKMDFWANADRCCHSIFLSLPLFGGPRHLPHPFWCSPAKRNCKNCRDDSKKFPRFQGQDVSKQKTSKLSQYEHFKKLLSFFKGKYVKITEWWHTSHPIFFSYHNNFPLSGCKTALKESHKFTPLDLKRWVGFNEIL